MRYLSRQLAGAAAAFLLVGPTLAAQRPSTKRSAFTQLLDDHWQWTLRERPILATTLGDHRYDRELGDLSIAAMDRRAREAARFLARADSIDTTRLSPPERVTRAI